VLALIVNAEFSFMEILWTFSIYLEAVAILPQLFLLQRAGEVEVITADYVFMLGGYRVLYLLNWIVRWITEPGYVAKIVWAAGLIQTAIYSDFFYHYAQRRWYGGKMTLPDNV
jgi:ER lumen protein retaining receptor